MKRLFNDSPIESITFARSMGYTIHNSFKVDDITTYPEVVYAAFKYRETSGTMCDYPCWIPEAGMVRINPIRMLEYYNSMTA